MELLRCSDSAKTLPGDLTLIEDVWQLLPNHYYDSEKQGGVRFDTRDKRFAKAMPVEQCVAFTLPLLLNITKQIKKDFQIHCPITGGWDSRIVLALLKQEQEQVSADYYTLRHQMDPLKDADLCVPRQMAEDYGLTYKVIEDLRAPDELAADFDLIFGENTYSKYFLSLAYTLQQNLNGGAILNGDIVGQIGKASLHRNVPASLFGPRYYCCKLHNYSAGAYSVMKQWKEQAYSVSSAREVCDLFTEEMRLGRWAAAENLIYSTLGLVWINLFNCKKIICSWEMVARKERMSSLIHKGYLKQLDGSLLHYGVNASEPKLYAFFKRNAFGFYIATYLKLFIQRET